MNFSFYIEFTKIVPQGLKRQWKYLRVDYVPGAGQPVSRIIVVVLERRTYETNVHVR